MIRIFLVILAVVAVVLGVILSQPMLYAAAGTLALFALLWALTDYRKRFGRSTPLPKTTSPSVSPEDELKSLGIMEIRPKASTPKATPAETHAAPSPDPEPSAEPALDGSVPDPSTPTPALTPTAAPSATPISAETASPRSAAATYRQRVLQPYLQALRGALDAHTTCLLRQPGAEPDYDIVAISSDSTEARAQGHFTTTVPLFDEPASGVRLRDVDDPGFPVNGLNYYRDTLPVRHVALAAVNGAGPETYLIVADTLKKNGLATERQHLILSQFTALLGTLLTPMLDDAPAPTDEDEPRPRRDIIAAEMEAARATGTALALGLIHLNDAEPIAADGPEAVATAETALAERIEKAVPDSRVERFGELTYGVFFHGPITDFDAWAMQLRDSLTLAAAPDAPTVSIGIALLQDRHDSPDAFRADATDALREAYESGTCTILE